MKTFNYKNQTFTCEIVHKNTNPVAKSKCIRIITETGIRNIYTIANGYSKAVAYDKNNIILSDIVIGKALCILGLMQAGKKFVFTNDVAKSVATTPKVTSSAITTTTVSSLNTMYRVIDTNTGSIAIFSSEIDVVSYCIGRTVKVDKVDISTGIPNINVIPNEDIVAVDIPDIDTETPVIEDDIVIPKRKTRSDYTTTNSNVKSDIPVDTSIEPPIKCIKDGPIRRKKV